MSRRVVSAVTLRVLTQLRHDRRTVALLLGVPVLLLALLRGLFDTQPAVFDRIGGPLLGLFPFTIMFLVASITVLRERVSGTLERLLTMPLSKLDILVGYGVAFALVAVVQAFVASTVAFAFLGLDTAGPVWLVVVLAVGNAVLGMALGLLVSAFATSEFQAVQFMPAIVFPQFLLCGLFVAREDMAGVLRVLADVLPLTYAYDALHRVSVDGDLGAHGRVDVAVIVGATGAALGLGAATLRRRTP